jgi:addiction module HigA family antidote
LRIGNYHQEARTAHEEPAHPGDLIKTEVIEALDLNVSKAAEILKVGRTTLSDLLHGLGRADAGNGGANRKAFGPDMDRLLRMQLAYDVAKTREHAREISIKRHVPA